MDMKHYKITLHWVTFMQSDNPDPSKLIEIAKDEFDNLVQDVYRKQFSIEEADLDSEKHKEERIKHDAETLITAFQRSGNSSPIIVINSKLDKNTQ